MNKIKLNQLATNSKITKLNINEEANLIGAGVLCCCGDGSTRAWRKAHKKNEKERPGL